MAHVSACAFVVFFVSVFSRVADGIVVRRSPAEETSIGLKEGFVASKEVALHLLANKADADKEVERRREMVVHSMLAHKAEAHKAAGFKAGQSPAMPIEDQLMGMTEPMKAALYAEMVLPGGPLNQAITFVRSHPNDGWSWCANEGQACWCNGQVRMGGGEASGWPVFTQTINVAGQVACAGPNFASTLGVRPDLHCQCADASEKQWQNAKLRFNSKSYLQEAWISLTRVMAQAKLLPMSGDRTWGGESLFSIRAGGSHDRTFMEFFLNEAAQYLPQKPSNCLEWSPSMYYHRFPACANGKTFSLDFEPDINKMHIDATNNHLHCDNVHLSQCLGNNKIDIALNTNVWEHEIEPFAAMKSLYDVMSPGGVMLFTVPFVAPFHGVPYDFYRYTKTGVTHLLEKAGYCVPRSRMAGGGDFVSDLSLFAGVGPGDFSQTEQQQAYHRGFDKIPDGAMVMMAVAYKKVTPTDVCPP